MRRTFPVVFPFLLLSILALLAGLWAGLVRLGWPLPALSPALPVQHGPLMISGFLGTMIALERVVAIGRRWMYAAPLSSGLGWVVSLALPAQPFGPLLITLGSLFTAGILVYMVRREPAVYIRTMAAGALAWLVGNLLWVTGSPVALVVWWWAAFLVLTIAGERLELSRVLGFQARHYRLFLIAAAVFGLGVLLVHFWQDAGARMAGAGMVAIAAWLLRFDIARRNMRRAAGLPRFIATCLFGGYVWLAVSGVLSLVLGVQYAGPRYDAILHALFVGFVLSMIFGHAPIIVPALTGLQVTFHPSLYLPLVLLHASLALRVAGGLAGWHDGRLWGGLLNEAALLGYMGLFAFHLLRKRR